MKLADELLESLSEKNISLYTADQEIEPHIAVSSDRYITVPDELKRIAVQFDNNVETVTFDCPRYWDGLDMSKMQIYINYMRPDKVLGMAQATDICINEIDPTIMHFNWLITKHLTLVKGKISFLVCVKKVDNNGNEENHWNSELNQEMYISEGLECEEIMVELYPAIITQLLTRMDLVEIIASPGKIEEYVNESLKDNELFLEGIKNVVTPENVYEHVETFLEANPIAFVVLEIPLTTDWSEDITNKCFKQTVEAIGIVGKHSPILDVKIEGDAENMLALKKEWGKVIGAFTNENSITFLANEKTVMKLTVLVKIEGTSDGSQIIDDDIPIDLSELERIIN